jgi:phage terminase large subunit
MATATRVELDLPTPAWAEPLLEPARYKGAKGGRSCGKSHFFAELAVEEMVVDPDLRFVCIREVQRSHKFSAKALIESKIREHGVSHLFQVLTTEIRRKGGNGVMIFEGMQDHTADSIKSLEGFGRAWVEEAQSLSKRSIDLLLPTIRAPGSEIWFSWNPEKEDDPVDKLLVESPPEGAVVVHCTYLDNPWCPQESIDLAKHSRRTDTDAYEHIWLGGYNKRSDAQILGGKWVVDEFDPFTDADAVAVFGRGWETNPTAVDLVWDGPYHGSDFGFAKDPTTLTRFWIYDNRLWIEYEAYKVGLDIDHTAEYWKRHVPGCEKYVVRGDSARPETISYLRRHGIPKIEGAPKWSGSVEDGIAHLRSYDQIVIHPRCKHATDEARSYSYKVDRKTGDILPEVVDANNHIWDGVRYGLGPLIQPRNKTRVAWGSRRS